MKNIIIGTLLAGTLQVVSSADKPKLTHPLGEEGSQITTQVVSSKVQLEIDSLIYQGTSKAVFTTNLATAGICRPQNNPYIEDSQVDAIRTATEAIPSMQKCLQNGTEMPGADLFCEITHIKNAESSFLQYFLASEKQRIVDCGWINTEIYDQLKGLKNSIDSYLTERDTALKNKLKIEISEKLLEYVTILNVSDIAALSGYSFMLEYISQETIKKNRTKNSSKGFRAEEQISQQLSFNWHYYEILRDWIEYIESKKFPSSVTIQYVTIIERLWTFRNSPKELEIYKSALEALNKKQGTSYGQMIKFTEQNKKKKSV